MSDIDKLKDRFRSGADGLGRRKHEVEKARRKGAVIVENGDVGKVIIADRIDTLNMVDNRTINLFVFPASYDGQVSAELDEAECLPAAPVEEPETVMMGAADEWASTAARRVLERLSKGGGRTIDIRASNVPPADSGPDSHFEDDEPPAAVLAPEPKDSCGPVPPNPVWSRPVPEFLFQVSPNTLPSWERVG